MESQNHLKAAPTRGRPSRVNRVKRGREVRADCNRFRSELAAALEQGRRQLEASYEVSIPRWTPGKLSCDGLLKAAKKWMEDRESWRCFQEKGRREREGGKFALRLLKKILPEPCKCMRADTSREWIERQTTEVTAALPDGFIDFVDVEVGKMFPKGWDHGYVDAIAHYAPNASACVERSCSKGGARAATDLDAYLAAVIGEREPCHGPLKYKEVLTAGKLRPLTIAPVEYNVLRPLHKLIYARLCKFRWLLKGPPSPSKFKRAGFRFNGTSLLSGDYAGATDNLDLRVSFTILGRILDHAEIVPNSVKVFALQSLFPQVTVGEETVSVRRGQMMGMLLSFPLLCLYNRVASKFALGNCPMLINGDDIVAETRHSERWFDLLPQLGLQPERQKTGVARNRMEINSTPFVIQQGRANLCPVARVRVLAPGARIGSAVGGEFSMFTADAPNGQTRLENLFLQERRGLIHACLRNGLTLPSLGFRGSRAIAALGRCGIVAMALKYARQLPFSRPPPQLASPVLRTRVVYGSSPQIRDAVAHTRRCMLGELIGSNTSDHATRNRARAWWREVTSLPPTPRTSLKPRLNLPNWFIGKTRHLYHGHMVSLDKWKARLVSELTQDTTVHTRVECTRYRRIPVLERLGIASMQ
jgi:hypothetical protein